MAEKRGRYTVSGATEEFQCPQCGEPCFEGDAAFMGRREPFCSRRCSAAADYAADVVEQERLAEEERHARSRKRRDEVRQRPRPVLRPDVPDEAWTEAHDLGAPPTPSNILWDDPDAFAGGDR